MSAEEDHNHDDAERQAPARISLSPPDLFACLTPTLYRSDIPTSSSHAFLQTLSLRSILHVPPTAPRSPAADIEITSIPAIHASPASWATAEQSARTTKLLSRGLRILEVAEKPALVVDPAGLFLAAWRRVVGRWNYTSVVLEYRSFAGSKARYAHEEFLECIDVAAVRKALLEWDELKDGDHGESTRPVDK